MKDAPNQRVLLHHGLKCHIPYVRARFLRGSIPRQDPGGCFHPVRKPHDARSVAYTKHPSPRGGKDHQRAMDEGGAKNGWLATPSPSMSIPTRASATTNRELDSRAIATNPDDRFS